MKSVLITGAVKNTGLGIARKFAQKIWAVKICVAVNKEKDFFDVLECL